MKSENDRDEDEGQVGEDGTDLMDVKKKKGYEG